MTEAEPVRLACCVDWPVTGPGGEQADGRATVTIQVRRRWLALGWSGC